LGARSVVAQQLRNIGLDLALASPLVGYPEDNEAHDDKYWDQRQNTALNEMYGLLALCPHFFMTLERTIVTI
jgi:hypothetical protein